MLPNQPILNPVIPFVDTILDGLKLGCIFTINGFIPNSAKNFQINLACGNNCDASAVSRSPIAFHFNPRFNSRRSFVARNTFSQSQWGSEEDSNSLNKLFPFVTGQGFEVMILVESKEYKVAVNGRHFITYNHRIPFTSVNTLNIAGDVVISKLLLQTQSEHAEPFPTQSIAFYDPIMPCSFTLPFSLTEGRRIFVSGRPTPYPTRFEINLMQNGSGTKEDIALHFNPRFSKDNDVVRNSRIHGSWGSEESGGSFPFERNISFDVEFLCENKQFVVYVNGQHFCLYRHRLSHETISKLNIAGDVLISSVIFK